MKIAKIITVGMTLKHAQWLGMAAKVAGGLVATGEAGRDAAQVIGHDCIGLVPESWTVSSADYAVLTAVQIEKITAFLAQKCSGWSGASRVNADRAETAQLLGI